MTKFTLFPATTIYFYAMLIYKQNHQNNLKAIRQNERECNYRYKNQLRIIFQSKGILVH